MFLMRKKGKMRKAVHDINLLTKMKGINICYFSLLLLFGCSNPEVIVMKEIETFEEWQFTLRVCFDKRNNYLIDFIESSDRNETKFFEELKYLIVLNERIESLDSVYIAMRNKSCTDVDIDEYFGDLRYFLNKNDNNLTMVDRSKFFYSIHQSVLRNNELEKEKYAILFRINYLLAACAIQDQIGFYSIGLEEFWKC